MTAPEQDEFEVTDEMVETATDASYGSRWLELNEATQERMLGTMRDALEAVAPLIRAEGFRQGVEACAPVVCKLCRDGVPLDTGGGMYDGWHMLTEFGGAGDGGTDYEECAAEAIRALTNQPDASEKRTET